jgi:hypothetical protein
MIRRIGIMVIVLLLTGFTTLLAATLTLPQTGQTVSYATGDDGDVRAGVSWPVPRFAPGTGPEADCITDNLTGLMWHKAATSAMTWTDAIPTTAATPLCGHSDWRVPNINELESLTHAGETSNAAWLNSQGFTSLGVAYYWTSTTRPDLTNQAFMINLGTANYEVFFESKDNSHYILPVRGITSGRAPVWATGQAAVYMPGDDGDIRAGVAWPSPRFEITGTANACMFDNLTGLMWVRQPSTATSVSWQEAVTYANDLTLCDYNDWRAPNRRELRSLTNYGTSNAPGYLTGQGFQDVQGLYWTSTTSPITSANAYVNFLSPADKVEEWDKTSGGIYWWAVRAGGAPDIVVDPGSINFGYVQMNQPSLVQTITITNSGTADLTISTFEITGTSFDMFDAAPGAVQGCALTNSTVAPGDFCTLDITLTPAAISLQDALLLIRSNDADSPETQVSLQGYGITGEVTLFYPDTGDAVPTNDFVKASWGKGAKPVTFKLSYSLDGGLTWLLVQKDITETSTSWHTPTLKKNNTKVLLKIDAFDASTPKKKVGTDKAGPFTIEAATIIDVNGGATCYGEATCPITWRRQAEATTGELFYTLNNGLTWKKDPNPIDVGSLGDTLVYNWTAPTVTSLKKKCKVKIVLKNNAVKTGTATSPLFSIDNAP